MSDSRSVSPRTAPNRPPFETFKGATCRGCYALGTACGKCEKCAWERERMAGVSPRTETPTLRVIAGRLRMEIGAQIRRLGVRSDEPETAKRAAELHAGIDAIATEIEQLSGVSPRTATDPTPDAEQAIRRAIWDRSINRNSLMLIDGRDVYFSDVLEAFGLAKIKGWEPSRGTSETPEPTWHACQHGVAPFPCKCGHSLKLASVEEAVKHFTTPVADSLPTAHATLTCPKVVHDLDDGYLHQFDDDGPYDVDGVSYCGRCHAALPHPLFLHPPVAPTALEDLPAMTPLANLIRRSAGVALNYFKVPDAARIAGTIAVSVAGNKKLREAFDETERLEIESRPAGSPEAPTPATENWLFKFASRAYVLLSNLADDQLCGRDDRGVCVTHGLGEKACSVAAATALLDEYTERLDSLAEQTNA